MARSWPAGPDRLADHSLKGSAGRWLQQNNFIAGLQLQGDVRCGRRRLPAVMITSSGEEESPPLALDRNWPSSVDSDSGSVSQRPGQPCRSGAGPARNAAIATWRQILHVPKEGLRWPALHEEQFLNLAPAPGSEADCPVTSEALNRMHVRRYLFGSTTWSLSSRSHSTPACPVSGAICTPAACG